MTTKQPKKNTVRDPRHDILFTPIQVGPRLFKNRFYQVPHCGPGGTTTPLTQATHRSVKAEGGWGVVCTEEVNVSLDSDQAPLYMGTLWDKDDMARLSLMTDSVHRHGSLAGVELSHGGVRAWNRTSKLPPIGPSAGPAAGAISGSAIGVTARAMDLDDIRRVKNDYALAARRAVEIGFDVIYVYGSAGYLPAQFLSPMLNKRTDDYGGSEEKRARFFLEVIEAVRKAVDGRAVVAVRISVDRRIEKPYPVVMGEGAHFIKAADDLVDLWDINDNSTEWALRMAGIDSANSRFWKEGYLVEWSKPIRDFTKKPIVGVARLTNPDAMAEVIRTGVWDLIGAARPSIADPYLPRKIEEGRYDDIRECTGSNLCIAAIRGNGTSSCVQNATAMEEYRRGWHPEKFEPAKNAEQDVLVVGAGAAGMECAIVLGKRGLRRVHVVEAEKEVGGHLRWATTLPGMGEWNRITNWRRIQLEKLDNVELITGKKLTVDEILDYGAETVVIATGAHWTTQGLDEDQNVIPGADASLPNVITPEQLMLEGKTPTGPNVLVYDCEGYYNGVSMAERLNGQGFTVTIASPFGAIAPMMSNTKEKVLMSRKLQDLGIKSLPDYKLKAVKEGSVTFQSGYADEEEMAFDSVILIDQRVPNDDLYTELKKDPDRLAQAGINAVYRIGDCVAPRLIIDSIFDGHRLGREFDEEDPTMPRLHKRELLTAFPSA